MWNFQSFIHNLIDSLRFIRTQWSACGLLRYLAVGTLICRASLIKHLLISPFSSLHNSVREGKFVGAKFGQALVVFQITEVKIRKEIITQVETIRRA